MSEAEVLFERRGAAGMITLNRPKALNAFGIEVVGPMREQLGLWAGDPDVTRVLIRSSSERAFAAGGDVRAMHEFHHAGRDADAIRFWREEYRLNHLIRNYPKPYIALIDGICMGGGVGLSVHGSHRVAGDRYLLAMPEVGIGFFPDVGASFVLPRLEGCFGEYLALTGARIGPGDGMALGLATHRVASGDFDSVADALAEEGDVAETLGRFAKPAESGSLPANRGAIDAAFSASTVEEVLERLDRGAQARGAHAEFARANADDLRTKSPTSLKIALEQMRRGRTLDFAACMRMEFRIVNRVAQGHDFYEGVRAVLLDKDNAPRWKPASLEGVSEAMVAAYFKPLAPEQELPLP